MLLHGPRCWVEATVLGKPAGSVPLAQTGVQTGTLRRPAPQLQVPLVARPRNQRYLQGEVVGFRRPLLLYGPRRLG